MRKQNA